MARWPAELHLVVKCLRAGLGLGEQQRDPSDSPAVSLGTDREPDWERFLGLVEHHRVTPLVHAGLKADEGLRIPDDVREQLRDRTQDNARRMLRLGGELVRLMRVFGERDIPALPLKGPTLALQVHGDITMRQVRDLDLLVRLEDLGLASAVLRSEGYQPAVAGIDHLSVKRRRVYEANARERAFTHPVKRIVVDLHWSTPTEFLPATLEELMAKTDCVRLANQDVPVLGRGDLLIYLAAHGSDHAWHRLSWLVEFSSLIPRTPREVWRRVCVEASQAGVERPLAQGLLVSARLFGTRIPDSAMAWLERDREAHSLAEYALAAMARTAPHPTAIEVLRDTLYRLRLKRSIRYRLRRIDILFFRAADLGEVALPDRLVWLHYVLRPFLWIKRRLSGGSRSFGSRRARR